MEGRCAVCGREETLTRHHLIPRTRHHNKRNKRDFDRAAVKQVVGVCRPCHSQIHALFTEKELEREYPTIEKLRTHAELMKFAAWIATKPRGFRCPTRTADR
jgi:Fe-S oxidoreductase